MSQFDSGKNFKTIIIGRSGVGKSTLLLRYVEGQFNAQKPTIGIDYRFRKVQCEGQIFTLQLWDSAGQQRYRTIVYNYFSLSRAAVIVFDITSQQSLQDAKMWIQQLVLHCGNDIPKILLANKSDKLQPQQLKQQVQKFEPQIKALKDQYKCQFFVVSAYTGQNVDEAFQYLVKQLHQANKTAQMQPTSPSKKQRFKLKSEIVAQKQSKKNKKECC